MKRFCLMMLTLLLVCFCACAEDNNWYADLNEHRKIGADGECVMDFRYEHTYHADGSIAVVHYDAYGRVMTE